MSYLKEPLFRGEASALGPLLQSEDLPAFARDELRSISRESDPEFFAESLFSWARRREQEQRPEAAVAAYAAILGLKDLPSKIFSQAQRRLAALRGQGSFGENAEGLLRRLGGNSESAVMWAGMALGTGIFAGARAALLSRFLSRPASLVGGGLAADVLASAGAFALETPVVWVTTKGLKECIHPGSQAWDAETNLRELTGLALGLGPMKLIGGASAVFFRKPLPGLVQESAMLGGVVLGRRLNEWAWDQDPAALSTALADGLAMLIDSRVGAHLMRGALPGLHRASQEWGLRARTSKSEEGNSRSFAPARLKVAEALSAPGSLAATVRASRSSGELPHRLSDGLMNMAATENLGPGSPSSSSVPPPPPPSGEGKALVYHGDHLPERTGGRNDPFEKLSDDVSYPFEILTRSIDKGAYGAILREIGFTEPEVEPTIPALEKVGRGEFGSALGRALAAGVVEFVRPGIESYRGQVLTDLPVSLQALCRSLDEMYGILEYSYRTGQREVTIAAEAALGADCLGQLPTLRTGLLHLLGPFLGSGPLGPQQAVVARGNGETTSLLFLVRHLIGPGGLSWRTPLIVTGRNPVYAKVWNETGNTSGELEKVGAKLGPDQPINFRHDPPIVFVGPEGYEGITPWHVWRSALLQMLNVKSNALHLILTPEYIEALPDGAILFQVIKGVIGPNRGRFAPLAGEQPSLLPYELINLALRKSGRSDIKVASGGGYIPASSLWQGEHMRMVVAGPEDPPRSRLSPTAEAVAEALAGRSRDNPYVTITTTHRQKSTEVGGAMKNIEAVGGGAKAVSYALVANSGEEPDLRQFERDLEFEIIRPALAVVNQMLIQEGIRPDKAEIAPEVEADIRNCLGVDLQAVCQLVRDALEPSVPVHNVGRLLPWVEERVLARKAEFGKVRRNTLIGLIVGLLEAWNHRGANIDIRAFLDRIEVTKEGVDSLQPMVLRNRHPGHPIELRRPPQEIHSLAKLVNPNDPLDLPPEIQDPLLSALRQGHPLLNEGELRHALERQDQPVVDLLNAEIQRLNARREEAAAHFEPEYQQAVLRQEQLLPRLVRAMSFGKPTHILDFPFYIQPYQNAVRILLSQQGGDGPNNYSYIRMDGPGAMDRLTQLALFFRSLGDTARLVMEAEATGLEAQEDSPKLWELKHTAREIVHAFLSDHPGRRIQLRVNGEEIDPGTLSSRGLFSSEIYAAESKPLLDLLNVSGGSEVTPDTLRAARLRTYELLTRFITREEGWPMLLGYFGGPMQRMIKGGLPRPEKPIPIGVYSGGKLVEGFMVYRGSEDRLMAVNHGLLSDFKRAFPETFGEITSIDYFKGVSLGRFLETYSKYAAAQGMTGLTYRLISLRSLPLENALVGKVEGVNPAVLRVFLGKLEGMDSGVLRFIETKFSAERNKMLAELDPLYEVEWAEARRTVTEILPRYLTPFEETLGAPLREHRLVRSFAEHGENAFRYLIRRQRGDGEAAQ